MLSSYNVQLHRRLKLIELRERKRCSSHQAAESTSEAVRFDQRAIRYLYELRKVDGSLESRPSCSNTKTTVETLIPLIFTMKSPPHYWSYRLFQYSGHDYIELSEQKPSLPCRRGGRNY